jgi:NAD(P)-dependent dehydrogenase (short-subunit alcohol dehydrogenase family)
MSKHLEGKVAAVTGAGSEQGIGKEVALALAAEGAKVVVNDIGKDADGTRGADRVVNEIKKAGGIAAANYDSVATMEGGTNIVKTALDNFGKIDIMVNTAGNYLAGATVEFPEKSFDALIAVHLKGMFACTQAAMKEMIKQKSGRIINFTSIGAFPPGLPPAFARVPKSIIYSTVKAGVAGFTCALSMELKEHNITVNAISPGAITKLFPFTGPFVAGGKREGPEYVAPAVVYLATDEAKDITGQFIFAGAGDIIVYNKPMQLPGPHMFIRKEGKWTVDELIKAVPDIVSYRNG